MKSWVIFLIICFALGVVNIIARPATEKDKETKSRTRTTGLTKTTKSFIYKNDSKKQRFALKHKENNVKLKNRTIENLEFKSSIISDKEIFEQVTGKENEIDERALVFIEQRYKVPFLHPVQQKHMQRNYKNPLNYRTFLSNTDANEDVRQVFLHKFQGNKRLPIRSHKDVYMGDKSKKHYEDNHLKEYINNNNLKSFYEDDQPAYNYRNNKQKVNIINSNLGHRYNDNLLKDDIVSMELERHSGEPMHHDRLLREQLISLNDHYRRAQDHESREKQLLNDIRTIKADIDAISAEHRKYLELLKVPLLKDVRVNSNKDFPQMNNEQKQASLPPHEGQIKEHKIAQPSVTQYYAHPTSIAIKSSPKSSMPIDNVHIETEPMQQIQQQPQQLQQLQPAMKPVLQPAYLNNPPDIDFHDSRILSKIDEMNSLSASMDKDKRSSSTVTFIGSSAESNRSTGANEMMKCVYPDCLKNWKPSFKNMTCDCKHVSLVSLKANKNHTVALPKANKDLLDVLQL